MEVVDMGEPGGVGFGWFVALPAKIGLETIPMLLLFSTDILLPPSFLTLPLFFPDGPLVSRCPCGEISLVSLGWKGRGE